MANVPCYVFPLWLSFPSFPWKIFYIGKGSDSVNTSTLIHPTYTLEESEVKFALESTPGEALTLDVILFLLSAIFFILVFISPAIPL